MCEKCQKLIACPNGGKRIVPLFEADEGGEWAKAHIGLSRDLNGGTDVFITTQVLLGARYANLPFNINNCPFCGEKLRGE